MTVKKFTSLTARAQARKLEAWIATSLGRRQAGHPGGPPSDPPSDTPLEIYLRCFLEHPLCPELLAPLHISLQDFSPYTSINGLDTSFKRHEVHLLLSKVLSHEAAEWDLAPPPGQKAILEATGLPLPFAVYCEDIRSPFNIGSIFRTAEALGFCEIVLSPRCPTPHQSPRLQRSAMGCDARIPWSVMELEDWILGPGRSAPFGSPECPCPIMALELGGKNLYHATLPKSGIVILGSEELGVSPHCLAMARGSAGVVTIPLRGTKASLNVGVSFGIFASFLAAP